jgi:hypothetical protein
MRSENEIQEQIDELHTDIQQAEQAWLNDDISYSEYDMLKDRYTGYISCFQYALGTTDLYGRTDSFET